MSPADLVLWTVLESWDFADVDGWVPLLADALEDVEDRMVGDELSAKLTKLALSRIRSTLAAADHVYRSVEFLADLNETNSSGELPKLRGVIDFLYRDAVGWHVLGIDRGTALEDDPWRGPAPGTCTAGEGCGEAT